MIAAPGPDPFRPMTGPGRGVHGWAFLLLGALFVGPMVIVWQDVRLAFGPYSAPDLMWLQLAIDTPLLIACWTAWDHLRREDRWFYGWFALAVLIGLCSLAAFLDLALADVSPIIEPGETPSSGPAWLRDVLGAPPPANAVVWGLALRVVGLGLAIPYVIASPRLRRTLLKPRPEPRRNVIWPAQAPD